MLMVFIYVLEFFVSRGSSKSKIMVIEFVCDVGNLVLIVILFLGVNGDVLYKVFFGIMWIVIMGLWTVGVLAFGAWFMALFSLFFWKVGVDLFGEVV